MKIFSRRQHDTSTFEGIVQTILRTWSREDLEYVKSERDNFGLVARAIRNEFDLWNPSHPLTANWHSFPEDRDLRDGIDYSVDHPDQVSAIVLKMVRERL